MAQSWYRQLLQIAVKTSPSFAKDELFIDRSKSGKSCIIRKRKFTTPGMNIFWLGLLEEPSIEPICVIKHAIRKGTSSHHESSWRKWDSWCRRREIDPIRCPLNNILDFLIDYFHEGYDEYYTIAGFRSVISAYHVPMQGVSVEQNERVYALYSCFFHNRPRQLNFYLG